MPDGYSSNMRDHLANCYTTQGFSRAGSEQLANNQIPSNQMDQSMMKAYGNSADAYNSPSPPQEQQSYSTPTNYNRYESHPDQHMDNVWGDGAGTPSGGESTSDGGNVWGQSDSSNQSSYGNLW
jgi:hypothetical protein